MKNMPYLLTICMIFYRGLVIGQAGLQWVVEGALHSHQSVNGDVSYSFEESTINNINYDQGTDPFMWGYLVMTTSAGISDTVDFEVLLERSSVVGSGDQQLTVYAIDNTMDLQTSFSATPMNQTVRLQFNLFRYGSRANTPYASGTGGIPKKASIGFSRPNFNSTSVSRLHTAEVYYIEDPLSNNPISCVVIDSCNQIDTFVTGQPYSDITIKQEDINATALAQAKLNNKYPYNASTGRTYIHVMERTNACDNNANSTLEVEEATYNVYFPPMSSFIIGRRDIKKSLVSETGKKSSIGFSLSPLFEPDVFPVEWTHWNVKQAGKNDVKLTWTTASETNNDRFEIEHASSVASSFETIGMLAGAGTTALEQLYRYQVQNLSAGIHYFRLKQVDFDGSIQYSPIKAIRIEYETGRNLIYPTLLGQQHSNLFVQVAEEGNYTIRIYDNMGKESEVFEQTLFPNTPQQLRVDFSGKSAGIYFIQCNNDNTSFTQKLLLQH